MLFHLILNSPQEHLVKQILNPEAEFKHPLPSPHASERRIPRGGILVHDRTQLTWDLPTTFHCDTKDCSDCCLKILFLSLNFFHATHSCQTLQGKQRTSEFPMGMVSCEWTLFPNPPNRQLDTFTASQHKNSLHNKEEAANRNKRHLETQEKNPSW